MAFEIVYWRFGVFSSGVAICVGVILACNDATLVRPIKSGESSSATSPHVIAMQVLNIIILPDLSCQCSYGDIRISARFSIQTRLQHVLVRLAQTSNAEMCATEERIKVSRAVVPEFPPYEHCGTYIVLELSDQ
ncbi:uncharacterized protein BO87DRAFT_442717 [Aspergillus neoniger CBS 115656]|uniref:Uncharacterized protein n=1 Tax=Aspergillus neoniger (strain CBS 115656) TaxID=1448310 RepID=A0A318Z3F1_ASPNB|nr:hypothetical protein BO87DRAFT_442717 [Aspergillus neoniger CBS 115656]PYH31492.1 hypothetical protein BO87DRAFT_442717 [Aspergillus neoniger CBS 115656]